MNQLFATSSPSNLLMDFVCARDSAFGSADEVAKISPRIQSGRVGGPALRRLFFEAEMEGWVGAATARSPRTPSPSAPRHFLSPAFLLQCLCSTLSFPLFSYFHLFFKIVSLSCEFFEFFSTILLSYSHSLR